MSQDFFLGVGGSGESHYIHIWPYAKLVVTTKNKVLYYGVDASFIFISVLPLRFKILILFDYVEQTKGRDEIEGAQQNVMKKRIRHFPLSSLFKLSLIPLFSLWKNTYSRPVWPTPEYA